VRFKGHIGRLYEVKLKRLGRRYDFRSTQDALVRSARDVSARVLYNSRFLYKGNDVIYFSISHRGDRYSYYYINRPTETYQLSFMVERRYADEKLFGRIFKSLVLP